MSTSLFKKLEDKNWKTFLANDEEVILSSKGHSDANSILASKNDKGILESIKVIPINNFQRIKYKEGAKEAEFFYHSSKENSSYLAFENADDLYHVVEFISLKAGLKQQKSIEGKIKPLLLNIFWVLAAFGLTYYLRNIALEAQLGMHHEVKSGRRRGIGQLLYNLVEWLGPIWTTLIGLGVSAYLIYNAYQRYHTPLNDIEYTR